LNFLSQDLHFLEYLISHFLGEMKVEPTNIIQCLSEGEPTKNNPMFKLMVNMSRLQMFVEELLPYTYTKALAYL